MTSWRRAKTPAEARLHGVKVGWTIPDRLKLTRPTSVGRVPVRVGETEHHVVAGSVVAQVTVKGQQLAYYLEPGEHLHCLVEGGEVAIPEHLRAGIMRRYFKEISSE